MFDLEVSEAHYEYQDTSRNANSNEEIQAALHFKLWIRSIWI